ncbi:S16 family serine protease [Methanobrevibacter sp. 87.7]|uniref:S16 family serine protease n=1 Tax=Methanobrevibacter sp. 87.7 TaxID=387957 RepID=UPI0035110E7F
MEFYDVNFSYIDNETLNETFVGVKEQGIGTLIPEGISNPGNVYTIAPSLDDNKLGVYKLETKMLNGDGQFNYICSGSKKEVKESINIAYNYFKFNHKSISGRIDLINKDYVMEIQDMNNIGMTDQLALPTFIALCSIALNKSILSSTAILGSFSLGGTIKKIEDLPNTLQVCLDAGAKKVLIPMSASIDLASVPPEVLSKFSLIFYNSPEDAVFKALGVE